jgi:hypothetical protein
MMLMADNGTLTAEGIEFIRRTQRVRLDDDEIQRIFNPSFALSGQHDGLRNTWREHVVAEEVRLHLGVRPARLDAGTIVFSGRPTAGLFANADHSRILISNRRLSTIFEWLGGITVVGVPQSAFQRGTPASDLRTWSVAEFLAFTLRGGNDRELARAYESTHVHYLTQRFTDPLQMIPAEDIDNGGLRRTTMTLDQFWGLGDAELEDRFARSLMGRLPAVTRQVRTGAREWFGFLFPGFVGELRSDALYRGLRSATGTCRGLGTADGAKLVGDKQPDLVQILVPERRIEVLDASLRVLTKWHNFKTSFYASVLRSVMNGMPAPAWAVMAMDFRDQRYISPL